MKKQFLILIILGMIGQFVGLVGFCSANNNDQSLNYMYLFVVSGVIGVGALHLENYYTKKINKQIW
jgi:Na+/citrate or Na+/malate symporter